MFSFPYATSYTASKGNIIINTQSSKCILTADFLSGKLAQSVCRPGRAIPTMAIAGCMACSLSGWREDRGLRVTGPCREYPHWLLSAYTASHLPCRFGACVFTISLSLFDLRQDSARSKRISSSHVNLDEGRGCKLVYVYYYICLITWPCIHLM